MVRINIARNQPTPHLLGSDDDSGRNGAYHSREGMELEWSFMANVTRFVVHVKDIQSEPRESSDMPSHPAKRHLKACLRQTFTICVVFDFGGLYGARGMQKPTVLYTSLPSLV